MSARGADATPAIVPVVQGAMYVATGLWPIVHIQSFERMAGPRASRGLVRTFGAVMATVGLSLLLRGMRRSRQQTASPLGAVGSLALSMANSVYAGRGRISPVSISRVIAQTALLVAWVMRRRRR
jgi:hypothetical protein